MANYRQLRRGFLWPPNFNYYDLFFELVDGVKLFNDLRSSRSAEWKVESEPETFQSEITCYWSISKVDEKQHKEFQKIRTHLEFQKIYVLVPRPP